MRINQAEEREDKRLLEKDGVYQEPFFKRVRKVSDDDTSQGLVQKRRA